MPSALSALAKQAGWRRESPKPLELRELLEPGLPELLKPLELSESPSAQAKQPGAQQPELLEPTEPWELQRVLPEPLKPLELPRSQPALSVLLKLSEPLGVSPTLAEPG